MSDKLYITKEGLQRLKEELRELVEVKRPEIAQRIKEAREMGDISENSAYDAARLEQSTVEGKISELEEIIKGSVVSESKDHHKVNVGTKVTVHVDGDEEIFEIVGAPEADPMKKRISHISPLGAALMGKAIGDKIEVEAPIGNLTYTILKIQ
jgi:transcription elongation factor GreA